MFQEFKKFAMRGNVVDMAVGIIIGGAFGKIVSSMVNDVIMPPIGFLIGNVNFSELFVTLGQGSFETLEAAQKAGAPILKYGAFIQSIVDFVIVAFAIFMMIRGMNKLMERTKKAEAPAPPTTKECPECLSTIPLKAKRCAHCASQLA